MEVAVELELAGELTVAVELGRVAELEPVVRLRLVVQVDVLQPGEQDVLPKLLDLVEAGAEDLSVETGAKVAIVADLVADPVVVPELKICRQGALQRERVAGIESCRESELFWWSHFCRLELCWEMVCWKMVCWS